MFEFWFHSPAESHHGTTHDFFEVCAQMAQFFNPEATGNFVADLLQAKVHELPYLRVAIWDEPHVFPIDDDNTIRLHKLPR